MAKSKQDEDYEQRYLEACENDDLETVKEVLNGEYFKNFKNKKLFLDSGLINAVRGGYEVMRYLLTSPELPMKADIHENSDRPLILAFYNEDLKYVEYLCSSPELSDHAHYIISPSPFRDNGGDDRVPFLQACERGTLEMIQFLLTSPKIKEHVDINIKNKHGTTGLFEACRQREDRMDIIQYLLHSPELKTKATLTNNCLTWPASNGNIKVVRYLFDLVRENPAAYPEVDLEEAALYCINSACDGDNLDILKLMTKEYGYTFNKPTMHPIKRALKNGTYVDDTYARSAFISAAGRASQEIIDYILDDLNYQVSAEELKECGTYTNKRGRNIIQELELRNYRNLLGEELPTKTGKKKKKI